MESILPEQSRSYGVVAGKPAGDHLLKLHQRSSKSPRRSKHRANLGVVGRYILSASIFSPICA